MVYLGNAKEIFDLEDEEFIEVECPEWRVNGEAVVARLRCLSGAERDRYETSLQRMVKGQPVLDMVNGRARLVAWSWVDENGKRLFGGHEDVLKLGEKNAKAINRLWEAACKLSGIDFDGSQAEEKAANFDSDQSGDSISD